MDDSLAPGKRISLRLLGSVDLVDAHGVPLSELLARPKLIGILAYLSMVAARGFVRRDKLVALFWPDDDEEHARASLRTALHRIRSTVSDTVIRTRGAEEVGIDPEILWCDASAFNAASDAGDCRDALVLYAGDFLDAFHIDAATEFQTWVDDQRRRLRGIAAQCAGSLSARAIAAGDTRDLLRWSRRELEINSNDEKALRNLLSALALSGEPAEAIETFETFSERYHEDLGLDVSPETRVLADRIRQGNLRPPATPDSSPLFQGGQIPTDSSVLLPRQEPVAPVKRSSRIYVIAGVAMLGLVLVGWWLNPGRTSGSGRISVWTRAQLSETPLPRSHHTLVYDAQTRQVLLFGGASEDAILSDVWRLSLATDGSAKRWQRIRTEADGPVRRWLHFAAYDPGDDTMIVLAGSAGHTTPCLADVWVLDNAMRGTPPLKWRKIAVTGPRPAPRAEFGAFYDVKNNRLVLHGGHDCIAPVFPDLWVLSLAKSLPAQWTELKPSAPQGAPPPLRSQLMAYDPENNRAIIFGGMDGRYPRGAVASGDVWILTNANGLNGNPEWVRPAFRGPPIPPTSKPMGAYDPATNRLIVFGGYHNSGASSEPTADVWVLEGANGLAPHANWRKITPGGNSPGPRVAGAVVFDPNTERLILFGGHSKGKSMGDVWSLTAATGDH